MSNMAYYDAISDAYSAFAKVDPLKQYAQYPSALRELGDIKKKLVLDVGCGDGIFSRKMTEQDAKVVGYDISEKQINLAKEEDKNNHRNIEYSVDDPYTFTSNLIFDKAVSVLVLQHAANRQYLLQFFKSTYKLLKKSAEFVSVIYNPEFKQFGNKFCNRRVYRTNKGIRNVFYDNKDQKVISVNISNFSKKDYEKSAIQAGFKSVEWRTLKIEEKGLKKLGSKFWDSFKNDCLYIIFIAKK